MKKILFAVAAVALLAAACNSQTSMSPAPEPAATTPGQSSPPAQQNAAQIQVDAVANNMNASIDSENSINTQSDATVLSSDQAVVNDSNGVANANY